MKARVEYRLFYCRERLRRSRHPCSPHWRHDDLGSYGTGRVVDRGSVESRTVYIARVAIFDLLDQIKPRLGVIDIGVGQDVRKDLTSSVDSDV